MTADESAALLLVANDLRDCATASDRLRVLQVEMNLELFTMRNIPVPPKLSEFMEVQLAFVEGMERAVNHLEQCARCGRAP